MAQSTAGQGQGRYNVTRKKSIRKALMRVYYQRGYTNLTCGELAHKLGLKSSTYLKRVVAEMEQEDCQISVDNRSGTWRVFWLPMMQEPLPERFITVNGKSCRVADWVGVK